MLSDNTMTAIKTWTFLTLFACVVYGQKKPPNYQQNEMPPTTFSCKDKIVGGYYADPETSCQMFHVCVNVVGTGVQDFRFLCPNDTAFDQENQICDDWYNIDCESATLYYSDNFDLYKLNSNNGGQAASGIRATPIPLGPSSASPNAVVRPQPGTRRPPLSAPVNNAVSENDDDYYLQRSDATDSHLQQDLLRGSSSGNFFSNRNRGLENPDDYDDGGRVVASSKDVPKKNTKAPFRKLLTGKKPVAEPVTPSNAVGTAGTTAAATTVTAAATTFANPTTVRQPNYKPTTYRSKDRGRVNYKTYLDKQTKADEYDYQKVAKPATATQSTTFAPSTGNAFRGQPTVAATAAAIVVDNAYQTTQVNNAVQQNNRPKNNDFLRIAPGNNNNNNNNNNGGFQSARINVAPPTNNNFQTNSGFRSVNNSPQNFQQNAVNYNQGFQSDKTTSYSSTTQNLNPANFQSDKIFTTTQKYTQNPTTNTFQQQGGNTFQQQGNNAFQQQSSNTFQQQGSNTFQQQGSNTFQQQGSNAFQQQGTTFQPANNFQQANTFQLANNFQQANTVQQANNFQQANTVQQANNFQQANTFQPNNNFQQANTVQPANNFQQSNNFLQANTFQPNNNFQSVTPTTQRYNSYQQSTNVFQSSTPYNTATSFQQQQQQSSQQPQFQSTTEHFSKDFKAKFDPYNSYHQSTNEEAGETLKTAPSTNLRPSELNALIQPRPKSINATLSVGFSFNKADGGVAKSTVVVPAPTTQKPRPFTTQKPTSTTPFVTAGTTAAAFVTAGPGASAKKAVTKDKDSSYDYAYYDDSNHNDYTDVVPEDFSRIQQSKNF